MENHRVAIVGIGATGSVLAAAMLAKYPEIALVDPKPGLGKELRDKGISVSGAITYQASVKNFCAHIEDVKDFDPTIIFLSTKTFHLEQALQELEEVYKSGMKIISTYTFHLHFSRLCSRLFGPFYCA